MHRGRALGHACAAAQALRWLCTEGTDEELCFGCGGALAALAAAPSDAGWRVACAWLGDLLVHLSRQVTAYHAVREARPPVGVAEEVYANAVAVLPVYARAVAAELRATSERPPPWQEPPPTMDDLLAPAAAQPAVDAAATDLVLARALTVRALGRGQALALDKACHVQLYLCSFTASCAHECRV